MTVHAGYDFGVNEIPRKKTLLRWLQNLLVSDIALESISTQLNLFLRGGVSGQTGTSLSGQGWTWGDPAGNLWVRSDKGPVKLFRVDGGLETNRFAYRENDPDQVPGYMTDIFTGSSTGTMTTVIFEGDYSDTDLAQRMYGPMQHSAVSGQAGVRILLQGGTVYFIETQKQQTNLGHTEAPAVLRSGSTTNEQMDWYVLTPASDDNQRTFYGLALSRYPGGSSVTTPVTSMDAIHYGWHWSWLPQQGPGGVF